MNFGTIQAITQPVSVSYCCIASHHEAAITYCLISKVSHLWLIWDELSLTGMLLTAGLQATLFQAAEAGTSLTPYSSHPPGAVTLDGKCSSSYRIERGRKKINEAS